MKKKNVRTINDMIEKKGHEAFPNVKKKLIKRIQKKCDKMDVL